MSELIDEQAYRKYEEWKARKLADAQDLSPEAYNTELRALDLAFKMGAKALYKSARLWDAAPGGSPGRFALHSPYTGDEIELS